MNYNYQDAPRESQQEYFGKVHTDNKETLQNALKRIEELEAQIEKMKCCQNCEHRYYMDFRPVCHIKRNARIENPLICKCDKWEIEK